MRKGSARRGLLLVAAVATGLLVGALPAEAEITNLSIDDQGKIVDGQAVVRGSITCTTIQGQWTLGAEVEQNDTFVGAGSDSDLCDGKPQDWRVIAQPSKGQPIPGPAQVCVTVRTGDKGVNKVSMCQEVVLG
jgi:Family of unknown function (DUF6299)